MEDLRSGQLTHHWCARSPRRFDKQPTALICASTPPLLPYLAAFFAEKAGGCARSRSMPDCGPPPIDVPPRRRGWRTVPPGSVYPTRWPAPRWRRILPGWLGPTCPSARHLEPHAGLGAVIRVRKWRYPALFGDAGLNDRSPHNPSQFRGRREIAGAHILAFAAQELCGRRPGLLRGCNLAGPRCRPWRRFRRLRRAGMAGWHRTAVAGFR